MSTESIASLLNTIRANASAEYNERIPAATATNISTIGDPMNEYQPMANEFLHLLVNRIALTEVTNRMFTNPLENLKKGTFALGSDVQHLFTNIAKANHFDGSGSALLTKTNPDVKVLYHRRNRQDQYPVTISKAQLRSAFTSADSLQSLYDCVVNSLYSGNSNDEFLLAKQTMATAVQEGKTVNIGVTDVYDTNGAVVSDNAQSLLQQILSVSSLMTFPKTTFNTYFANKPAEDTSGNPVTTWTPKEDQILIIRADVLSAIDVNVLAAAFHIDKDTFYGQMFEVDDFGSATNVVAMLVDRSWFAIYDNYREMTEFYNGQGLFWNYWWNVWQTYSVATFANAVAFVVPSQLDVLSVSSVAGATSGTSTITVNTPIPTGYKLVYQTGASAVTVAAADVLTTGWSALTSGSDITATTGNIITVAMVDSVTNEAVGYGTAYITSKA